MNGTLNTSDIDHVHTYIFMGDIIAIVNPYAHV